MKRIVDSYPLSPLQEGMLFNALYAPNSGVDISQIICRMHHSLEILAFKNAWNEIVSRHAVLRTGFRWEGLEEPLQDVYDTAELEFEVVDIAKLLPAEQDKCLEKHLKADRHRGFDISKPPLIRIAAFLVSDNENVFVWSLHHLTLDAVSCVIILKEVFAIYEALIEGKEVALDKPLPYRNYIDWLKKQDMVAAEHFWRDMLKGFAAPVSLSAAHDRQRLSKSPGTFGEQEIVLPSEIKPVLKAYAKQNGFTLYTCFAGAWSIAMSRYSGAADVVFATVRGCRGVPIEGADSIVGMFINTLPVRARIDEKKPLTDLLKELRGQHVAARSFEHSPLARIQRWSEVPAGMSLFESLVNYRNVPWDVMLNSLGGNFLKRDWTVRQQTNEPLFFDIYEEPELRIVVDYDLSLFDDGAITAMLGHYKTILEGIASNPDRTLGDLPMLTRSEERKIIVEWNSTEADYPRDATIHGLFERQAERTPENRAVVCNNKELTYGELNARANQLAHRLLKLGVRPDTLVAVSLDRDIDLIVAILAILKSGGAYVPLDRAYPMERLAFVLEDTNAQVLLTEEKFKRNLPPCSKTICLDTDWQDIATESAKNPASGAKHDNLCYVIYTSGSTGKPKGVCIRHMSVTNLLADFNARRSLSPDDHCSLWTSYSFDVSVYEIFSALHSGATLYIATDAIRFDSAIFVEWLKTNRISHAYVPPLMLNDLAAWLEKNPGLLALKNLVVSVEPTNEILLASIADRLPGLTVINAYGPTEATIFCTIITLDLKSPVDRNVPIGIPVQNSKIHILDPHLRPVPVGIPGEIYIGGTALAREYLNRPELTLERFIPDPFGRDGDRIYKSGDLARYLPDGNIDFIGRMDFQVKVRGFRVEPGEIETVLGQHQFVKDAVVLARSDPSGTKRLAAYIIPVDGKSPTVAEMREFLAAKLPDYMVPSTFVVMETFPLTPNGKLDRSRLPEPELLREAHHRKFVAPRNEIETHLVVIWEKVLGVKPISVTDNFFEIGGHSLLAVRLFSEINRSLGKSIELAELFQSPTIEKLARIIQAEQREDSVSSLVAIRSGGSKPPVFFVHAYGGGVFFYRELAQSLDPDQPFYGLQSVGLDGKKRPHTNVRDMAAHYIREMRAVQPEGPYYLGGRCLGAYVAFEMANQLHAQGEQIAILSILDSYWAPQADLPIHQGIMLHARNLMRGSLRERLAYFWRHVGYRTTKTKIALTGTVSDFCFLIGRPIPSFMKDFYVNVFISEINMKAEKKYRPSIYPGKITFFQATAEVERDPCKFWGNLTSAGVEVHMVPAAHMDILIDPNVKVLAEKLDAALLKARTEV